MLCVHLLADAPEEWFYNESSKKLCECWTMLAVWLRVRGDLFRSQPCRSHASVAVIDWRLLYCG
jgi:hypothetical protein